MMRANHPGRAAVESGMSLLRALVAVMAIVIALVPGAASAIPLAGQSAPDFSLPTPSGKGKPVTLAALRGHPVYVNFFASWCGPCNDEAPSIARFRSRYAKRGLTVLGVDELEPSSAGAGFAAKYHAPFSLIGVDESGTVGKEYGAIVMPVHVFINARGVVTTYHLGQMTDADIDAAIKGALK
jgi:thiol-disulfide isomerase/thioredoxin